MEEFCIYLRNGNILKAISDSKTILMFQNKFDKNDGMLEKVSIAGIHIDLSSIEAIQTIAIK